MNLFVIMQFKYEKKYSEAKKKFMMSRKIWKIWPKKNISFFIKMSILAPILAQPP